MGCKYTNKFGIYGNEKTKKWQKACTFLPFYKQSEFWPAFFCPLPKNFVILHPFLCFLYSIAYMMSA